MEPYQQVLTTPSTHSKAAWCAQLSDGVVYC